MLASDVVAAQQLAEGDWDCDAVLADEGGGGGGLRSRGAGARGRAVLEWEQKRCIPLLGKFEMNALRRSRLWAEGRKFVAAAALVAAAAGDR